MPALTSEQTSAVARWIAAGDNLSAVQRKLTDEFGLSLTYMDVRFLVDDLDLQIKDPAPKVDASDVSKAKAAAPAKPAPGSTPPGGPAGGGGKKGFFDKVKEKVGLGGEAAPDEAGAELPADEAFAEPAPDEFAPEDELPPPAGGVRVEVDAMTLLPGAVASGTVTFSDGVTGKWIVDQYGRPGFTEVSQPGYRPSMPDSQAFMQELSRALQRRGF